MNMNIYSKEFEPIIIVRGDQWSLGFALYDPSHIPGDADGTDEGIMNLTTLFRVHLEAFGDESKEALPGLDTDVPYVENELAWIPDIKGEVTSRWKTGKWKFRLWATLRNPDGNEGGRITVIPEADIIVRE